MIRKSKTRCSLHSISGPFKFSIIIISSTIIIFFVSILWCRKGEVSNGLCILLSWTQHYFFNNVTFLFYNHHSNFVCEIDIETSLALLADNYSFHLFAKTKYILLWWIQFFFLERLFNNYFLEHYFLYETCNKKFTRFANSFHLLVTKWHIVFIINQWKNIF